MKSFRGWIAIIVAAGSGIVGCGSAGAPEPSAVVSDDWGRVELSCEIALSRLDSLIAKRSAETDFPPAALLEAKELLQMGRELYLEREYALALDLVEQGIELVEEKIE